MVAVLALIHRAGGRVAAAIAARKARELKVDSFATIVHGAGSGGLSLETAARATMEAIHKAGVEDIQLGTDEQKEKAK